MDLRSHRTPAAVVPFPPRAERRRPTSRRTPLRRRTHDEGYAAGVAARMEQLAFMTAALRAELQACGFWIPTGALDTLGDIAGTLETEAARIEAGPDLEGAA